MKIASLCTCIVLTACGAGGASDIINLRRGAVYHLQAGYVACAFEDDLTRISELSADTDALARFMVGTPACFFTSSAAGRRVYLDGTASLGFVKFHAVGRPTPFFTYVEALGR